jgi:hypothetical protein
MPLFLGRESPPVLFPILMAVLYLPVFWLIFLRRRKKSCLVVHERGISGNGIRRFGQLQDFAVRFDDIDHIRVGRKIGRLEHTIHKIASIEHPELPAQQAWIAANVTSIVLREHPALSLGLLLARFQEVDVASFFAAITGKVSVQLVAET